MTEHLQLRIHDPESEPVLVYLPGLHGDWTLLAAFRQALTGRACLAEVTYPRRDDWSLDDYARVVEETLTARGINAGWIIGESFSSQVVWALIARVLRRQTSNIDPAKACPGFNLRGIILAGGFVRHPLPSCVRVAHHASRLIPMWLLKTLCQAWISAAARRHRECVQLAAELGEFVARRANEQDRTAINSRYQLITANDLRPLARQTTVPVFHLSGAIDPIVPWWPVRRWLRRECPGYSGSQIIPRAGHNVLLDAPGESADQILDWIMKAGPAGDRGS